MNESRSGKNVEVLEDRIMFEQVARKNKIKIKFSKEMRKDREKRFKYDNGAATSCR